MPPNLIKKQGLELITNGIEVKNIPPDPRVKLSDVAVIMAVHNEELVIRESLISLKNYIPANQIYIGNDGSKDKTLELVKEQGCNVVDIQPNRGKAGALAYTLKYFNLCDRYKAILIFDADSRIDHNYFKNALPLFNDPKISTVAVHAKSKWYKHKKPVKSMFYVAYRVRLYLVIQAVLKYGQSWKYANVMPIAPGFASMYRTSVLKQIKIDTHGFAIEDYFMTLRLHYLKLGQIAYTPKVYAYSQDPNNLKDYFKQVKRWNLGFWQAFLKHGFWPSFFWTANGIFILEMTLFSLIILISPLIFIWYILNAFKDLQIHLVSIITIPNIYLILAAAVFFVLSIQFWLDIKKRPKHSKADKKYITQQGCLLLTILILFYLFFLLLNLLTANIYLMPNITIGFLEFMVGLLVIDYFVTYIAAFHERKPIILLYGFAFFLIRYVDSFIFLYTLPLALIVKSTGSWKSPKRYQNIKSS